MWGGKGMKKVLVQDIARRLQLSRNTVAKALKNSKEVSDITKDKVVQTALEMGYNKIDEQLIKIIKGRMKEQKSIKEKKIVVISKKDIVEFWNRIIVGISDALKEIDYSFNLIFIGEEEEKKVILPKEIRYGEVEGIISLSIFNYEYMNALLSYKLPVVFFDMPVENKTLQQEFAADTVIVDGYNSVNEMVKELIESGKKKFSFIGDIHYCKTIFDRYLGFRAALEEARIPYSKEISFTEHMPVKYYDYNELEACLKEMPYLPDAMICANDDIGVSAVQYFTQKGYRIPEDIAITGFDDKISAKISNPQLTTVHVDNEYIGYRLVETILRRIQNPDLPYESISIGTKPIYRKTT